MLQTLLTTLSACGGLEVVKWLFNRRTQNRISEAKASIEETSAESARRKLDQETVVFLQNQLSSQEERFAQQSDLLHKATERELELTRNVAALELELQSTRCDVADCPSRHPPRNYKL
ncbi:MAG: hypothetical protein K2G11_06840 [Muribaculaceae bacterium]|nr:hypothetical protein [Bacteroidales bacterium]MDE6084188.1 hypothetical protein [Muribaculaceae bacterium]